MNSNSASITCVTITRNHAPTLPRLLHSVRSLADDCLVLDHSSSDGTSHIAGEFDARLVSLRDAAEGEIPVIIQQAVTTDWILFVPPMYTVEAGDSRELTKFLTGTSLDVVFLPEFSLENSLDYLHRPALWRTGRRTIPPALLQPVLTDEPVYDGLIDMNRSGFTRTGELRVQSQSVLRDSYRALWKSLCDKHKTGKSSGSSYYFKSGYLQWKLKENECLQNHLQSALQMLSQKEGNELVSSWHSSAILGLYLQTLLQNDFDFESGEEYAVFEHLQENMFPDIRLTSLMGYLFWKRGYIEKALTSWITAVQLGIQSVWTTTSFQEGVVVPFIGILSLFRNRGEDDRLIRTVMQFRQRAHERRIDLKPLFVALNHSHPQLLTHLETVLNGKIHTLRKADKTRP